MTDKLPRRAAVYHTVRERILRGDPAAGRPVNESRLAAELGVSRTPLREALFLLEHDGFIRSDLARGFSVLPLTAREVREIYPILWTLECLALRSIQQPAGVVALERINRRMEMGAANPAGTLDADIQWHAALLHGCPNAHLLRMIASLKHVTFRYEYAYMRAPALIATSLAQHRAIGQTLETGDVAQAVALLEGHWRVGMEALLSHVDWVVGADDAGTVIGSAKATSARR